MLLIHGIRNSEPDRYRISYAIVSSIIDEDCHSLSPPVMGLHKYLPIKAGLIGSHARWKRICKQWGARSSLHWHPHDKTRPFEAYSCRDCCRKGKLRTKAQQEWHEKKLAFRESHPVVGACESCGETKDTQRFAALEMVLCPWEILYYKRYGRLRLVYDKASENARSVLEKKWPVVDKCHSCGEDSSTASKLIRYQGTGLVLCAMERLHSIGRSIKS